jgi:hypothetical protein
MGKLASSNVVDLGREKEDVCFLATLVMGVGCTLSREGMATIDEKNDEAAAVGAPTESKEPVQKKTKRN